MRIRYPSSFLRLLLAGFACAAVPLLGAFGNAFFAFEKLSRQSEQNIQQAVQTTRSCHALLGQINNMERSAKQYFVLQDRAFLSNYQNAQRQFLLNLKKAKQQADQSLKPAITKLADDAGRLHNQILSASQAGTQDTEFLNQFGVLATQADRIVTLNNSAIDQASDKLQNYAKLKQRQLFLQSLVLIPLALVVSGVIAWLLIRPIRRMDDMITRLGSGDYDTPIDIDGPGNLRLLGQRLNWLRHGLKEINQQKQQFLQRVSHDLKTPLTAIKEASELLQDDVGGKLNAQQQEIVQILRQNSVRLQNMIENLLQFTKHDAIGSKVQRRSFAMPALVREVLDAHTLSIRNKLLQVHTDFALLKCVADREKMRLILDNLLSNAFKYVPNNGNIWLNYRLEGHIQRLEIKDDGPGLDGLDKTRLFEPFYKNEQDGQTLSSTGLGLAIVKQLVELHGGTIEIAGAQPNRGAHFVISIPVISETTKQKKPT